MSEQTANLCTTDAAESLRAVVAERDREIERLKEGQSILILARDEQKRLANEYRDLWSRAALKDQPGGVVQWPEADEIMQMAFEEGQPGDDASGYYFELEEFDLFIQRLMEEVARLNSSPVSACWMMPTAQQLEQALESVPSFHDLSAELLAPAMLEHLRDVISAGEFGDAYRGARDESLIWKRRALEAEAKIREQDQIIDHLTLEAQGETRFGEPAVSAGEPVYQFQCREIGEGDWGPCDHIRYMYCQKSPEMDTRVVQVLALSAPSHGEQVREVVPEELLTRCADWCDKQPKQPWYGRTAGDMVRTFMACQPLAAAPSAGSQGGDV